MNKITDNIKLVRQVLLASGEIVAAVGDRVVPFAFTYSGGGMFPFIIMTINRVTIPMSFSDGAFGDGNTSTRDFDVELDIYGDDAEVVTDLADETIEALTIANREINVAGKPMVVQRCRLDEMVQQPPRDSEGEVQESDFIFQWTGKFLLTTSA